MRREIWPETKGERSAPPEKFQAETLPVKENKGIIYHSWEMLENLWKANETSSFSNEAMWMCFSFCYLFPKTNFEFCKDDIVHLWMAEGFIAEEETGNIYFNKLQQGEVFQVSHLDYSAGGGLTYKLNSSVINLLQQRQHPNYLIVDHGNSRISENTTHASLHSIDSNTLKELYVAKRLSTLLIPQESGSSVSQLPYHFFLKLPLLRVVDLSQSNITELPSSIRNSKHLRYLNLSGTPIMTVPDSLCCLHQLQVLKLVDCPRLVDLPQGIRKLINLRHFDVDVACLIASMPPRLGDLMELQSLPAFVVGKEDGYCITELKHMNNLHGTLRILGLENVSSLYDAKEAYLDKKINLNKLVLEWGELVNGFQVLEDLQPHTIVEELVIAGYGGLTFPSWIGDPVFTNLMTVTVHDCKMCKILPSLGQLKKLKYLCISEMNEVEVINQEFCAGTPADRSLGMTLGAFPELENLTFTGMARLEEWSGTKASDFPYLKKMSISDCVKLRTLPRLSLFISLQELEISDCPALTLLPGEIPRSLQALTIVHCQLLQEQYIADAETFAHVHSIWVDHKQIHLQD